MSCLKNIEIIPWIIDLFDHFIVKYPGVVSKNHTNRRLLYCHRFTMSSSLAPNHPLGFFRCVIMQNLLAHVRLSSLDFTLMVHQLITLIQASSLTLLASFVKKPKQTIRFKFDCKLAVMN